MENWPVNLTLLLRDNFAASVIDQQSVYSNVFKLRRDYNHMHFLGNLVLFTEEKEFRKLVINLW
jgi:hypothetical protein